MQTNRRRPLIAHFQFCLPLGAGIGPSPLRGIWSEASGCDEVGISRAAQWRSPGFVYTLSAPANMDNPAAVEEKLRLLLSAHLGGELRAFARLSGN
jgi:hypothetical protein